MKKAIGLILTFVLLLFLMSACAQSGSSAPAAQSQASADGKAAIDSLKTIGDAMALGGDNTQYAAYGNCFVYAFEFSGAYYRLIALMPEETTTAIFDLDWSDEDHDEKLEKLVAPLAIDHMDNLSENIPTQAEMDALIGKTGEELMADGWTSWGWNLDTLEFHMDHGGYSFLIVFDGSVEDYDSFDEYEDIKTWTVKSIEYEGIGDATDIELDDDGNPIY